MRTNFVAAKEADRIELVPFGRAVVAVSYPFVYMVLVVAAGQDMAEVDLGDLGYISAGCRTWAVLAKPEMVVAVAVAEVVTGID